MKRPDIALLFETGALRFATAEQPFWYTSGELGPYYINTHFVCGGEQKAQEVLDFITKESESPETLPSRLLPLLDEVYQTSTAFKTTINYLAEVVERELPLDQIDLVSGGQRRDWFFSPLVARLLQKPCLYLYNDGLVTDEHGQAVEDLEAKSVLNVCDLLRVGSSYTSKWIPAIAERGGILEYSIAVVDRNEGGLQNLSDAGVKQCLSLFSFDASLFQSAVERGLIAREQFEMISLYVEDPRGSMRDFLVKNPAFLEESLKSPEQRVRERAESLIRNDYYELKKETK